MSDAGFFETAAKAVEKVEFRPDLGRILGALARTDDFKGLQLLALFLENDDDVGGSAGTQGEQKEFHGAGSGVGGAVGVERDGMARRSDRHKLLFADPLDFSGLAFVGRHEVLPPATKDSDWQTGPHTRTGAEQRRVQPAGRA